jgi:hypothetical protein
MGGGPHLALALRACPFPAREGMAELRSALRDDALSPGRLAALETLRQLGAVIQGPAH